MPHLINVVMGAMVLRLACYAALPLLPNPWLVLGIELLHGITFGVGFGAGTVHVRTLAPAGLGTTMNGLFGSAWGGVGGGLGGLVGGWLVAEYGAQAMFGACAAVTLAGWVACCAAQRVAARSAADGCAAVPGNGVAGCTPGCAAMPPTA